MTQLHRVLCHGKHRYDRGYIHTLLFQGGSCEHQYTYQAAFPFKTDKVIDFRQNLHYTVCSHVDTVLLQDLYLLFDGYKVIDCRERERERKRAYIILYTYTFHTFLLHEATFLFKGYRVIGCKKRTYFTLYTYIMVGYALPFEYYKVVDCREREREREKPRYTRYFIC